MNVEMRILALEKNFSKGVLALESEAPGTCLSRTVTENGIGWILSIGPMGRPKTFFYGDSIEEVLTKAENPIIGEVLTAAECDDPSMRKLAYAILDGAKK